MTIVDQLAEALRDAKAIFDWLERRSLYQDLGVRAAHEKINAAIAAYDAQPTPKTLTDEQIDRIAENCAKGMPNGISGFCKTWGWRQFARELLDVCAGYERAPAAAAYDAQPSGWISVKDRLPELNPHNSANSVQVLFYVPTAHEGYRIEVGSFWYRAYGGTWQGRRGYDKHEVSHWQPLPAAPTKNGAPT